jgi:GNAT superfamily N-acetyltransferase
LDALAPELIRKPPRYPLMPAALLGRLAIAASSQGKGLGAALLADAFLRVARVEMGVYAMLVDAKAEAAQRFYERFGFNLLAGEHAAWSCRSQRHCAPWKGRVGSNSG